MTELFRPKDLKHIPGQEGRVDSIEKARAMAEAEDHNRTLFLVKEYADYLAHPSDDSPFADRFKQFQTFGVTPEYLETFAEIRGERVGARHDAHIQAERKSDLHLAIEEILSDLYTRIASIGLEPEKGLPPNPKDIHDRSHWSVAHSTNTAAYNERRLRRDPRASGNSDVDEARAVGEI